MIPGPVFGSTEKFEGLGIFFDTYDNERAHVNWKEDNMFELILISMHIETHVSLRYGNA